MSGAVHFCVDASGDWASDASDMMECFELLPGRAVPFHIVARGACWFQMGSERVDLLPDDVIAFPTAAPHIAGCGTGQNELDPLESLPTPPWPDIPVIEHQSSDTSVRIHCGFFTCSAFSFPLLARSLPDVLVGRAGQDETSWFRSTIRQIDNAIANTHSATIERLCEAMLVQMLEQHLTTSADKGWVAAAADPVAGRVLAALHEDPDRNWTLDSIAESAGASRSVVAERFSTKLGISPVAYLRDWRLHQAALALTDGDQPIAEIAYAANYQSEAAFSRAFSRHYGMPPGAWRAK